MSERTKISWADHTASPWFGCTEVSPGCSHCYARELTLKNKWAGWGDFYPRIRSKGFWTEAYRLDRKAKQVQHDWERMVSLGMQGAATPGRRPRMFTSLIDPWDKQVPVELRSDLLKVVFDCQNLDWLLLTKRPENTIPMLQQIQDRLGHTTPINEPFCAWVSSWVEGWWAPQNVWFGVTVEDQNRADERIPELLKIPAKVRWLSVEPLLEKVNLEMALQDFQPLNPDLSRKPAPVQWVVVGGESGRNRRDCGVDAIVNVVEQCRSAKVPVWVKQDSALKPGQQGRIPNDIWKIKELPI